MGFQSFLESSRKSPVTPLGSGKMWAQEDKHCPNWILLFFSKCYLKRENSNQQNHVFIWGSEGTKDWNSRNPNDKEVLGRSGKNVKDVCKISVHYGQPPWCSDAQLLGREGGGVTPMAVGRLKVSARTNTGSVSSWILAHKVVFLAWSSAKSYRKASL